MLMYNYNSNINLYFSGGMSLTVEDDADEGAKDVARKGPGPAVSSCITFRLVPC